MDNIYAVNNNWRSIEYIKNPSEHIKNIIKNSNNPCIKNYHHD